MHDRVTHRRRRTTKAMRQVGGDQIGTDVGGVLDAGESSPTHEANGKWHSTHGDDCPISPSQTFATDFPDSKYIGV